MSLLFFAFVSVIFVASLAILSDMIFNQFPTSRLSQYNNDVDIEFQKGSKWANHGNMVKRNTDVIKIQGAQLENHWHPPLQPKRLGRIGSNFRWVALRRILSGASRRFLNFVLGAEILGIFMLILGPLEGPKIP